MLAASTRLTLLAFALGAVLLAGLAGCGRGDEAGNGSMAGKAAADPAAEAEWSWLEQAKQSLDRKRERLAGLRATPAGGPGAGAIEQLSREVDEATDELDRRLIEFLNSDPPVDGEPMSERQLAALRMKSDEDILLARDYIERGGDYRRAIEIYEQALAVDPGNSRLRDELAKARAARYMTEERFSRVKEGMTPEEVRQLLGSPNPRNVRDYPEQAVVAWFFPKDESGAAAAVWFKGRSGELAVYQTDFSAIQPAPDDEG